MREIASRGAFCQIIDGWNARGDINQTILIWRWPDMHKWCRSHVAIAAFWRGSFGGRASSLGQPDPGRAGALLPLLFRRSV